MSSPTPPEVTFRPPADQQRITVTLADLLEFLVNQPPAAADGVNRSRITELAAELLAELRRSSL